MALFTLQLSSLEEGSRSTPVQDNEKNRRKRMQRRQSFVMVKGAALLLQEEGEPEGNDKLPQTSGPSEQELHLQSMLRLLREEDTLKLAVRLEPIRSCLTRYLVVVSSMGRSTEEQTILLGVDFAHDGSNTCTVGTVLPVWSNTQVFLDGDGGFSVTCGMDIRAFKPISVQTMWALLQMLHKACEAAEVNNYIPGSSLCTGLVYYLDHYRSPQGCINAWTAMSDITSTRKDPTTPEREETEKIIRMKLRDILRESDLENITSKQVRTALEQHTHCALQDYTEFIDNEMIMILAQMDRPSEIFPYLYLGSEWNASNLEELQKNKVTHILNVTREIDNFFPETFTYLNIRVLDEESTNLLQYWKETHSFISIARRQGTRVLVHCKMGVSRSASTVIAYAMKEYEWTFEDALKHVKERRSIVQPNAGFLRQLQTYQGILGASKQRHSYLWDPSSTPPRPQLLSLPESLSGSVVSLCSRQRKMNLRALMRSISEMEVTDTAPEKRTMGDDDGHLEKLDIMPKNKESVSEQLDSVSSMDGSLLEGQESFMDQEVEQQYTDTQEGKLTTDSNQNSSALLDENPSVDEVFGSSTPSSPHSRSTSSARRRSRRRKKLVAQQSLDPSWAGHVVKSQSVLELQGATLVSNRLQEAEHHARKARITRQSNVGETPEEL
ncbi:protein phosphatase Slingshot homolog isoform X1 [Bufo gargarizans]|uniref:protein phosphatase Slingshot homolog isoform X1 n=1 Tax=Bufo gargarizans TaxID=30331 RepID=UPI001CF19B86|nr:protein phosphatase Slingshot homolog isoform X1 [Bufo gargarizans]